MTKPEPGRIVDALYAHPEAVDAPFLYAILDGARNPRIAAAVVAFAPEHECLYRGELDPALAAAAPYLVRLDPKEQFVRFLADQGWGDSWGIFMQSYAPLSDLRQHFRKFLMVYDPELKPLYFRYYDPRVLRVFLPTCNSAELAGVFGPVEQYLLEDQDAVTMLSFSRRDGALRRESLALA